MTSSTLTPFRHEADGDEEFSHLHAIAGNKYRIVVWINYPYRVVYVRFIGTRRQYDTIDAQTV
ncbi:MAG TPA: type II toxin-antitoxin system HigB family toxin [Pyrinomonadaceae bacterium]